MKLNGILHYRNLNEKCMKNLYFILFSFFAINVIYSQEFSLNGRWRGTDTDGLPLIIAFDSEGYVTIGNGELTMGGASYMLEGRKLSLQYEVNMETVPFSVDFILYDAGVIDSRDRKKGFFRIINGDTIELVHEALSQEGTPYEEMHRYVLVREILN